GGSLKHLAHARAAAGALVPDDHRAASDDPAVKHGGECFALPVKDPRRATVMPGRGRRDLHDRALGGDVAPEHAQATLRAERSINRPDDLLRLIHRGPRLAAGGPATAPAA